MTETKETNPAPTSPTQTSGHDDTSNLGRKSIIWLTLMMAALFSVGFQRGWQNAYSDEALLQKNLVNARVIVGNNLDYIIISCGKDNISYLQNIENDQPIILASKDARGVSSLIKTIRKEMHPIWTNEAISAGLIGGSVSEIFRLNIKNMRMSAFSRIMRNPKGMMRNRAIAYAVVGVFGAYFVGDYLGGIGDTECGSSDALKSFNMKDNRHAFRSLVYESDLRLVTYIDERFDWKKRVDTARRGLYVRPPVTQRHIEATWINEAAFEYVNIIDQLEIDIERLTSINPTIKEFQDLHFRCNKLKILVGKRICIFH